MYQLPELLAQKLLTYLANKPYAEVYQLIHELQSMAELKESCDE